MNFKRNSSPPFTYSLPIENYLKPKKVRKKNSLLFANRPKHKSSLRLKLLEHPVLTAGHKSKWMLFKEQLDNVFKSKIKKHIFKTNFKFSISNIKLPRFLTFLNARNDHIVCKRKSGFEIYCELASIHGFKNFVGATTLQRTFWFSVVLIAIIMSGSVLLLSYFMNANTPTILYSETTQYPVWSIPFPAVTICNLNKISKIKAENLARKFQKTTNITLEGLVNSFTLALSTTENIMANSDDYNNLNEILKMNNYTMYNLLEDIAPNCDKDLLRCKFKGQFFRCGHIFKKIQTSFGPCCSFNYKALKSSLNSQTDNEVTDLMKYISTCGYNNGLNVLMDPHVEDYRASPFLTAGFQIFIHDAYDFVDIGAMQHIITPATANKIRILPQQTYATGHINSLKIRTRKCYLPNERRLHHFGSYSQANCLAECRSLIIFKKCHCTLPYRPKMHNGTVCNSEDIPCYVKYKNLLLSNKEQLMCDCYPLCEYNMYKILTDSAELSRKYSLTEKRLYRGINVTNHILLRVFVGELYAERLRLDVYENWLTFLGTFGGITSLYMGYSILSGFELIFFVFVRPACNWWSKKQIQYRIKKRQKKIEQEQQRVEKVQKDMEKKVTGLSTF